MAENINCLQNRNHQVDWVLVNNYQHTCAIQRVRFQIGPFFYWILLAIKNILEKIEKSLHISRKCVIFEL